MIKYTGYGKIKELITKVNLPWCLKTLFSQVRDYIGSQGAMLLTCLLKRFRISPNFRSTKFVEPCWVRLNTSATLSKELKVVCRKLGSYPLADIRKQLFFCSQKCRVVSKLLEHFIQLLFWLLPGQLPNGQTSRPFKRDHGILVYWEWTTNWASQWGAQSAVKRPKI